jgi:2-iminobutanoate/2-iminopropanoate deaminase
MRQIHSEKAPAAVGPYSQAVLKNETLFVSGQLGIDPATGNLREGFAEQAEQVFANLSAVLEAAEMSFANVVKVSIFLQNLNDFAVLNGIYTRQFSQPFPARETVQVARLPLNGLIEISLIAMK